MKKLSLLLLVAVATTYAADNVLGFSNEVIEFGDRIVANALEQARLASIEPLTGSVYESYLHLHEDGFQGMIAKNNASVAKALEYLTALSDKESEHEVVKQAIFAFKAARLLPKSAEQEELIAAWTSELKLAFAALTAVADKDFPKEFTKHAISAQLILLNNGKVFSEADIAVFEGALLASLAGYENRKQAMQNESLFLAVREAAYPTKTK